MIHLAAIQVESGDAGGALPGGSNVMPLTISGPKASIAVAITPLILHDVHLPEITTKCFNLI